MRNIKNIIKELEEIQKVEYLTFQQCDRLDSDPDAAIICTCHVPLRIAIKINENTTSEDLNFIFRENISERLRRLADKIQNNER